MKKFLFFFFVAATIWSCNSGKDEPQVASATTETKTPDITYPYPIQYSAKFEIGNSDQSKKILDLWKDYDTGEFNTHKDYFADSVRLLFPDGSSMNSVRDSVVASTDSYRKTFSSVSSQVDAVIPLKSTDKNEDWVCVWGKEVHTQNGKTDSVYLQETWRFNKAGKVDLLMQYQRLPAPVKK